MDNLKIVCEEVVGKEEGIGGTILEVVQNVKKLERFTNALPCAHGNPVESYFNTEVPMWESLKRQYGSRVVYKRQNIYRSH
jgi:hypothetical protein